MNGYYSGSVTTIKILNLDILTQNDRFVYSQLAEITAESGGQIQYVQEKGTGIEYTQNAWKELERLLNEVGATGVEWPGIEANR